MTTKVHRWFPLLVLLASMLSARLSGETATRIVSGIVVTAQEEAVPGVTVTASTGAFKQQTETDEQGGFVVNVPAGSVTLSVTGQDVQPCALQVAGTEAVHDRRIHIQYRIAPVHDSMTITASALDPSIDNRNGSVYKNTLFSRDDQIFDTLAAGINAGQHEGG